MAGDGNDERHRECHRGDRCHADEPLELVALNRATPPVPDRHREHGPTEPDDRGPVRVLIECDRERLHAGNGKRIVHGDRVQAARREDGGEQDGDQRGHGQADQQSPPARQQPTVGKDQRDEHQQDHDRQKEAEVVRDRGHGEDGRRDRPGRRHDERPGAQGDGRGRDAARREQQGADRVVLHPHGQQRADEGDGADDRREHHLEPDVRGVGRIRDVGAQEHEQRRGRDDPRPSSRSAGGAGLRCRQPLHGMSLAHGRSVVRHRPDNVTAAGPRGPPAARQA